MLLHGNSVENGQVNFIGQVFGLGMKKCFVNMELMLDGTGEPIECR